MGRILNFQHTGHLTKVPQVADVGATLNGIKHPDVGHAECAIVINALLKAAECVILRQNFNADQRVPRQDRLFFIPCPQTRLRVLTSC